MRQRDPDTLWAFAAGAHSAWQTNKYRASWCPAMVVCSDNPGCQTNGDRTQTLTLPIYVLFSFASHGTSRVGFAALHRRGLVASANALHCPGESPGAVPRQPQKQAFADVEGIAVLAEFITRYCNGKYVGAMRAAKPGFRCQLGNH